MKQLLNNMSFEERQNIREQPITDGTSNTL